MTENCQNTQQVIPAAWESVLAQMSEEYTAKIAQAQVQERQQMTAFVQARTAPCYRLKIDHAREKISREGAYWTDTLRWRSIIEPAERVLEATQVYLAMLKILEKPEVQNDLTEEEFYRLVDLMTEECLFVIKNPEVWPT